jgi:hypothetical protein
VTPPDEADSNDSADAFLREVARAPERPVPAPAELDPDRLAHFRILGRVGRGGMGIVYRAEDEKLRRTVALKVLPPGFEADDERRRRFLREARAAAAVTHPNIATVHEIGESDGRIFIAMELVEGRTLRAALAGGPLAVPTAVGVALQIARALAKAHDADVVHRDLKPENVVLGEDLHVKLLDFGLAKVRVSAAPSSGSLETATRESILVGTPAYMPPEQARGLRVTPASDVFAFGVMLYEMVTGRRPFAGTSVADLMIAIDRDTPAPASTLVADVPPALDRIIARCLEKEPEGRYPDARALGDELSRVAAELEHAGTDATESLLAPAGAMAQGRRRRRWRWRSGLAALAALAAVTSVAAYEAARGRAAPAPAGSSWPPSAGPVSAPEAALACPPLVASGVDEPSGWLGAGAANIVCRRAGIAMGGRLDRVRVPAELLDLPRQPTDDFPRDPYCESGARERAIAAAKTRTAAWVDGGVARQHEGFRVTLVLRASGDGRELARGSGEAKQLYQAVRAAMRPLVGAGAIERAASIDPVVAEWTGVRDVDLALQYDDWHTSIGVAPEATREERERLERWRSELGPRWTYVEYETVAAEESDRDTFDPVALDRSSPAAFAISAPGYAIASLEADPAALAAEALHLREAEPSPVGRRALLLAAVELLSLAGQAARVHELMLGALEDEPRSDHAWELLGYAAQAKALGPTMRAFAAWVPEDQGSWGSIGKLDDHVDAAHRIALERRSYAIAPEWPHWGWLLGQSLIAEDRREEVRSLAGTMLAVGETMDPVAQALLVQVDGSEGRFGAAIGRAKDALARIDRFDEGFLLAAALDAAMVAGRARDVADGFARRFVLTTPPRLSHGHFSARAVAIATAFGCAFASPGVARACFARLQQLVDAKYFRGPEGASGAVTAGLERFAQGDMAGAARAWRPLLHEADGTLSLIAPIALDAAGDADLAERIDADNIASGAGNFGGASLAHARSARRALARGEREKARELAQKVVDAWGAADVPIPAVVEMKALLASRR